MKYRIIASKKSTLSSDTEKRAVAFIGKRQRRRSMGKYNLPVKDSELFGFGIFYDPDREPPRELTPLSYQKERRRAAIAFAKRLGVFFKRVIVKVKGAIERIPEILDRKKERPYILPAFCGALCAALTVAVLSAGVVVYKLFVADYFGSYEVVQVPDFVGAVYPNTEIFSDAEYCNITVDYEYDNEYPEGTVISQNPSAGVSRRVYSNRSLCNVNIVVSLGERIFTMNDLSGQAFREAALELKREAVKFSVEEEYSDTVAPGRVIDTFPEAGRIFSSEDTVVLKVSKGPEIVYVTVPELYGMTEGRAAAVIEASGLKVGSVSYAPSEEARGTVISQSHTPYSEIREGESISFTVSAGISYNEKTVPDIYGLTVDEARARLAEYGLVCGNIYAVANGAPSGTVIAQTPIPETPILSGTVSVDIYVSS